MQLPISYTEKMRTLLGEEFEQYMESFKSPPCSGIRINTLKTDTKAFLKMGIFDLEPVKWCQCGFYINDEQRPAKNWLYHAGLYYIQEPSAMSAAEVLPVKDGDRVLDLCAAPGGKTTQLAAKLNGTGVLFSNDISAGRAKAIVKNIELSGVKNCFVLSESSERLAENFGGYFDAILVDAPCGGEGMFRKKPDLIKTYTSQMTDFCEKSQREILDSAAKMLKAGGYLVYSTCTFSPEEDEGTVRDFLIKNRGFEICEIDRDLSFDHGRPEWADGSEELEKCARIWPHRQKGEGHFIALLKKTESCGEQGHATEAGSAEKELKPALEFMDKSLKSRPEGIYKIINGSVYILPEGSPELTGLRVLRSGLLAGEIKNGRFEPSQALAMALKKGEFINSVDFGKNDERVIRYLKGETVECPEAGDGWCAVCAEGFVLGWAKSQRGRLKNKYAVGWRWE